MHQEAKYQVVKYQVLKRRVMERPKMMRPKMIRPKADRQEVERQVLRSLIRASWEELLKEYSGPRRGHCRKHVFSEAAWASSVEVSDDPTESF